ncbi:hypothetical protein ACFY19_02840 [Streptosporangium saharense]
MSPLIRAHVNVLGLYSFTMPELPGGSRPLGDPGDVHDDGLSN